MVLMAWLDARENLEYLENGCVTSTVDSALPGITRIRTGREAPCDPVVLRETGWELAARGVTGFKTGHVQPGCGPSGQRRSSLLIKVRGSIQSPQRGPGVLTSV